MLRLWCSRPQHFEAFLGVDTNTTNQNDAPKAPLPVTIRQQKKGLPGWGGQCSWLREETRVPAGKRAYSKWNFRSTPTMRGGVKA